MYHRWNNGEANYFPQGSVQGNQVSFYNEDNHQNTKHTKAYLNPQMVNYEFIGRSLSKLHGGNKIHVNPNFKGNGLSNMSQQSYPHVINTIHLNSQNMFLSTPGTSNVVNTSSTLPVNNKNKLKIDSLAMPQKSQFKKVSGVSVRNNNCVYSWSKNKTETNLSTNVRLISNVGHVKKSVHNYSQNAYKFTSPKKASEVYNEMCQPKKNHSIYKSKTKIINESKMKLINNVSPKPKSNFNDRRIQLLLKKQLNLSKYTYNKNKTSVSRVANAVRSKYKYLKNVEQYKKSKYKIDKRNKLNEAVKKKLTPTKIKDITKLFPNSFYNKMKLSSYNIYNINTCHTSSRSVCLWRKDQSSDSASQKIINNKFPNKKVIKIGGILYKSTTNKLILANKRMANSKKVVNSPAKGKKKHVVYVRGEKFVLERNGKALRRQSENVTNEKALLLTPKRIDIGGVTYVQKSQNVLIRTNVHQARQLVKKAKNKSIALLANLHKRSSMPCMIYHRFGTCNRHKKGLCMYKHDPKNIALCKKFLKGNCTNDNCLLSHQIVQEKMATCHFFLKGLCVRENCPFPHVKLSKNAAICENFIQGFCKLGKECTKRHLHQCPEFDKTGSCSLGPKCPYPHKQLSKVEFPSLCENPKESKDKTEKLQYYVHSSIQKKQKKVKRSALKGKDCTPNSEKEARRKKNLSLRNDSQSNDVIKCLPKRVKLDKLPCFIPLNSDS